MAFDTNHKIYFTQFQDIETQFNFKNTPLDPNSNVELGHYLSRFIINNYHRSFKLLMDNYISIIKKEIVILTLNIEELINNLSELKNSLEINEDLTKVQNNLRKSILDCENEIENLYSEKAKKENELENFLGNKTRFSIVDLLKLVDFSKLPVRFS